MRSVSNVDNIQEINYEPTADQKEYIDISTTSDYKLYYKSTDELEFFFCSCCYCSCFFYNKEHYHHQLFMKKKQEKRNYVFG